MNLQTLSRLPDDLGGPLGPPIRKPTPAPEPVRRPDGIVIHPDGKMSTDLPPPACPATPPVWPFPSQPSEPEEPAGDVPICVPSREPLKVGDKVRYIGAKSADIMMTVCKPQDSGGLAWAAIHGNKWEYAFYAPNEGVNWERV